MKFIEISTTSAAAISLATAVKSHSAVLGRTQTAVDQHEKSIELLASTQDEGRNARLITTRARAIAEHNCVRQLAAERVKLEGALASGIRALNDDLDDTDRMVLVNNIACAIEDLSKSGKMPAPSYDKSHSREAFSANLESRSALFREYSLAEADALRGDFDAVLDIVHEFSSMELHSLPVQAVAAMQKKLQEAIGAVGVADGLVAWYRPLTGEFLAASNKTPADRFHAEASFKASRRELESVAAQITALLPTAIAAVNLSMAVPNFRGRVIESGMIIVIVAANKLKLASRVLRETESRVAAGSVYSDTDEMFTRIEDYMRSLGSAA